MNAPKSSCRCLLFNARQIVQITKNKDVQVLKGDDMRRIDILTAEQDSNQGYSMVIDSDGLIGDIGEADEIDRKYSGCKFEKKIDCSNKTLVPGLVDGHTHPVFAGDRVGEFAMKLAGATYMDVHKEGGGIHFTVRKTREASEEELYEDFKKRAQRMSKCGTTLLEAKSGYGLDTATELKMLRVLERANRQLSSVVEISGTFCGAHAVPQGSHSTAATDNVINEQMHALKKEIDAGRMDVVENCDVFCETGVFTVDQTEKILLVGKEMGLEMNFHGEELSCLHSAEMGAKIGARAISHLEEISPEGIVAMAESGSAAVILPTTAYVLKLKSPPVRAMINAGVPVALGSDFNPNAHCYSMPLVMNLACVNFGMTIEEALGAGTLNAAASLGRGLTHGALQVGRVGDVVVLDAPRWEHLIYQIGDPDSLIHMVIKKGVIAHEK